MKVGIPLEKVPLCGHLVGFHRGGVLEAYCLRRGG
jgi:hypothetical protein